MILKNLGLASGPLVRTIFDIFFYVLKSMLLVFWDMTPGPLVRIIFALFLCVLNSLLLVFWGLKFLYLQELSLLLIFLRLTFFTNRS